MAVTANQVLSRQTGDRATAPVAASTTIYEATMVFRTATGYADDDTGSGANRFFGIANAYVDNSAGSAGDNNVELLTEGVYTLTGSGFTQADAGRDCYATDNFTITTVQSANAVPIGRVSEYISATQLRVKIDTGSNLEHLGCTLAVGAESANVVTVTCQLHNRFGGDHAKVGTVHAFISSDASGLTLSAAHDGGFAIATDGLAIELLANQYAVITTEADGDFAIAFTDTGAFTAYLIIVTPDGRLLASALMTHTA